RILKYVAFKFTFGLTRRQPKVVERAGLFQHAMTMRQRDVAIDLLALLPEPAGDGGGPKGQGVKFEMGVRRGFNVHRKESNRKDAKSAKSLRFYRRAL